jgi:phenylalanyl-tRNA synthetase alpha chain
MIYGLQTRSNLELLKSGSELEKEPLEDLKKRKLIAMSIVHYYIVRRGQEFTTEVVKQEAELTSDLLINNEYERRAFKPYNFNALGSQLPSGQLHPLMKV